MFSLTSIWTSIIPLIFFLYHYRRTYPTAPAACPVTDLDDKNSQLISSTPTLSPISSSGRPVPLPHEILDHIFSFHVSSLVDDLRGGTVRDYRIRKKCLMREFYAVAQCSKQFNLVMLECLRRVWASCGLGLCSGSPKRYSNAAERPARGIWIITAEKGCLPLDIDLSVHIMLEVASINYHDGAQWSKEQQRFRRFRCVSAYPRSLRQLEVLHSHTPEVEVIKLVSDCCPGLTELRLVRCTMFNDPECWYWRTHTRNQDHDYMQTYDPVAVVDYANRMALLLRGLQQLESIHIGHYLIAINAVFAHRLDKAHRRYHPITDRTSYIDGITVVNDTQLKAKSVDDGPPINATAVRLAERELWAKPCHQCEKDFRKPIEIAERLAAGIIAAHFKSLKHVSFASFLSDRRICPSSWMVGRQQRGPDLYVRTEDPNRPRSSRIMQPMVRVGDRWQPPQAN